MVFRSTDLRFATKLFPFPAQLFNLPSTACFSTGLFSRCYKAKRHDKKTMWAYKLCLCVYCKGGKDFFTFSRILFKCFMISNYNKDYTTPTISANQIPAIPIQLNQALQYKRAVESRRSRRINEEMDKFDIPPSFGISENQEMGVCFFHFVKLSIPYLSTTFFLHS